MKIVMIAGPMASGKSTIVQNICDELNQIITCVSRDNLQKTTGKSASMQDVLEETKKQIGAGEKTIYLDNTFLTAESRKPFIELAKQHGYDVEIIWVDAKAEECQFNACMRMVMIAGKILTPEEIKAENHPNLFPVAALFKAFKTLEKPTTDEGFSKVEVVKNHYVLDPEVYDQKAIILDYDGTLRDVPETAKKKYPCDVSEVGTFVQRAAVLKKYQEEGYLLLGASNQSGIAKGDLSDQTARDCFDKTNADLGVDIEYHFCPHKVPPISCYCRKPLPGMGVQMIVDHFLDPTQCIMVGDQTSDKTFAKRSRFQYQDHKEFFGD